MPTPYSPTADETNDIEAALRIAASSIEMTALHMRLPDWDERDERDVQVTMRRQAARYRKLAAKLRAKA